VARRYDLVDKGRPVVGPLLLQNGDEDEVELVEKGALGAAAFVVVRELDDEVDDEVADTWSCQQQPGADMLTTYLDTGRAVAPSIVS
jgi:hypothetical protein